MIELAFTVLLWLVVAIVAIALLVWLFCFIVSAVSFYKVQKEIKKHHRKD